MEYKDIEIEQDLIAKLAREVLLIERKFSNNETKRQIDAVEDIKKALEKEVR